jgi:hypothetical protein
MNNYRTPTNYTNYTNYRTPTIYISQQTNPQQHIRGVMKDSVERGSHYTVTTGHPPFIFHRKPTRGHTFVA